MPTPCLKARRQASKLPEPLPSPRTSDTTIGVGSDASGTLDLTDELLDNIDAGKIVIGSTAAGNADINTATAFTAALTVITGGNIQLDISVTTGLTEYY